MKIGERIKNRRLELGLSVDEVANKLGKNRATIYRYEKDDIKDFPITVLEPLAKVLETTPADLMGWNKEYDHYTNLASTYFNSIMHWSAELGLSKNQTTAIRDHFSTLLSKYKSLLERYMQTNLNWKDEKKSYIEFYSRGKKHKNANDIQAAYIREDLEKQLQDLASWIDVFPDVVSRRNTDYNDELFLNAAHERTDISVTEKMKKHDDDIMDDENF